MICTNLLKEVSHIKINYKKIALKTEFDEHLIEFSKTLFSNVAKLKYISVVFVDAHGSNQYVRLLTEKFLPKAACLETLFIHCENTDLTEFAMNSFIRESGSLLRNLESLTLNVFGTTIINNELLAQLVFDLPNLKTFCFGNNIEDKGHKAWDGFLNPSISNMPWLEVCELRFDKIKTINLELFSKVFDNTPKLREFFLDASLTKFEHKKWDDFAEKLQKKGVKIIHIEADKYEIRIPPDLRAPQGLSQ